MAPSDELHNSESALEGWKEIASHLQRDTSTARRWERDEGLPVRRHEHQKRASVYAYRSELDDWRSGRATSPQREREESSRRPLWLGAALAAVLLVTLVAITRSPQLGPIAEAQSPGRGIRTVEVCEECDWPTAISPNGRWASETDWKTWNVVVRDIETGERRMLTSTGSGQDAIGGPNWHVFSPEGGMLAFDWQGRNERREIRTIALDSSSGEPTVIYAHRDLESVKTVGWSPSNEILVTGRFVDQDPFIGFVPAGGGELRTVKTLPAGDPNALLSPDGKWIAYDVPPVEYAPTRDVYLLAADGSQESLVSGHEANEYVMGFTPGSEAVMYSSDLTGTYGIWAANIGDAGAVEEPRLVVRDLGPAVTLAVTPDGAMYFVRAVGSMDVFSAEIDWSTRRAVSGPSIVEGGIRGSNKSPMWAPDGRSMIYRSSDGLLLSERGQTIRLLVRSWPDGTERAVEPQEVQISYFARPHFSPDGKRVMMQTRDRKSREGIYSIDLESGAAELLLAQPPESGLQPGGWLDDGTWFYEIEYLESHEYSIFRVDPGATGGGREIHSIRDRSFGGRIMALQVSPRRDLLAFRVLGNQEIWVLPVEGGEARRLFQSPEGGWPGSVNWTPDGEALIAVVYSPNLPERQGLYRIPIDGSPTTRMDLLAESMQSISIHPDGKTILYRAGGPDPRLWKMENYWSPGTEPGATE